MFESLSCSVLINSLISQQSSAGKLSTTFEPHVISKWLRREHNFCCGHGSSKCNKYLNTPDKIKEGLDERTYLEHIPQSTALLYSTDRAEVALLPLLLACQCRAQVSSTQTLEQRICLGQFLQSIWLSHLCNCSISCHSLRGSLSKSHSLYAVEL